MGLEVGESLLPHPFAIYGSGRAGPKGMKAGELSLLPRWLHHSEEQPPNFTWGTQWSWI